MNGYDGRTIGLGGVEERMMKVLWIVVGIIALLLGAVWTLQGLDILGGSAMSGESTWAIVGPIVAALGLLALMVGVRRRDSR
ncbi:MAG: hypothetical protein ACM30G_12640 [Micromonosporaceae bacterium]